MKRQHFSCLFVISIAVVNTLALCPSGWTQTSALTNPGRSRCLRLFGGNDGVRPTTWSMAEEYCNQFKDGHLATIHSDDEMMLIIGK